MSKEVLIYIRREIHKMLMLFIEDKKFTNHKGKKVTSYNKAYASIYLQHTHKEHAIKDNMLICIYS